jgi:hypothetical protein
VQAPGFRSAIGQRLFAADPNTAFLSDPRCYYDARRSAGSLS